MDIVHRALKFLDHNRYAALGVLLAAAMLGFVGCGSFDGKVTSSITGETVDADALGAEYDQGVATINANIDEQNLIIAGAMARIEIEARKSDELNDRYAADAARIATELEKQDRLVNATLGVVKAAIPAGGQYIDLLVGALGLGGVSAATGLALDNRRKDKIIKKAKA